MFIRRALWRWGISLAWTAAITGMLFYVDSRPVPPEEGANIGAGVLALWLVLSGWDRTARASFSTTARIPLTVFADTPSAIIAPVRFTVTIEGSGWTDVQQLELPRLPREGELIETKYGTCQVTHSEATPEAEPVAGKIVCSIS